MNLKSLEVEKDYVSLRKIKMYFYVSLIATRKNSNTVKPPGLLAM
jgi:hypothetical protein